MAPVSKKRTSLRARAAKSPRDAVSHPRSTYTPPSATLKPSTKPGAYTDFAADPDWRTSKKDKRAMKHSVLMNRVRDAGVRKPAVKRRRPGRKLGGTGMEGLGDALPEVDGEDQVMDGGVEGEDEWEGVSEDGGEDAAADVLRKRRRRRQGAVTADGKMVMKSLKHRPGAAKRKRAMEGREMERFGKNLAQLVGSGKGSKEVDVGVGGGAATGTSQADRWAALRRFIGGSMETDRAFAAT